MIYLLSVIITYVSITASSYLNYNLHWSSPLTISILGLLGTFYSYEGKIEKGDVHALIVIGAFAGTTPEALFHNHLAYIITANLIYFLFMYLKHKLVGIGGKLGFISFISCLCLYCTSFLIQRLYT